MNDWLLTILILLPLVGAGAVMFARRASTVRAISLVVTLLVLVGSLLAASVFDRHVVGATYSLPGTTGDPHSVVQFVGRAAWIPSFHVEYLVGIDGLSLPMIVLTAFVFVVTIAASWNVERMTRGYFALLLLLESGVLGVFCSLDLFLFYVFFEVSLVPMYFLIGVWGGPRREYAAIKFFLYTLVGSIALLVALIGIYLHTGTFDLVALASPALQAKLGGGGGGGALAITFFGLLMFGFFVKVPAVPLHTWLPDAHVEAPTPASMILAAILLKMGGYGILRVAYPLFPDAAKYLSMPIATIGVVGILYGALCALAQADFKRLVAYSSVSQMGFVVLGIAMMTPESINGAIFMMVAHGITSAAMFFVVGVVFDRANHRDLTKLGGLTARMPTFATLAAIVMFASLGLPGLCGFVGEAMVLLGSFGAARAGSALLASGHATPTMVYVLASCACAGIVAGAAYTLWAMQRAFLGPVRDEHAGFHDADLRERSTLVPLVIAAVLLGVLPGVFVFAFTDQTVGVLMRLLTHSS